MDETGQKHEFPVLVPSLQISFYHRLEALRDLYLHEALRRTVERIDIKTLDDELAQHVEPSLLRRVASFGVRGEVFFPTRTLIEANPFLLGYYRLLYGLSQKEFYSGRAFGRFKMLEDRGVLPTDVASQLVPLCASLIRTGEILVERIDAISLSVVHDLQMLTLGPQLRGSRNTELGVTATQEVYQLISSIVAPYIVDATPRTIRVENDSHRTVMIEFFSDPDVRITEELPSHTRPLVSIEIKGGSDASNVHNRLGEAEKSHRKAQKRGFWEFWTIVRVDVDLARAREESPTTTHFFSLDAIRNPDSAQHHEFRDTLGSLIGIQA